VRIAGILHAAQRGAEEWCATALLTFIERIYTYEKEKT
jgi:hypothetical protein